MELKLMNLPGAHSAKNALSLTLLLSALSTGGALAEVILPAPPPAGALELLGKPIFSPSTSILLKGWQVARYEKSGGLALAVGAPFDLAAYNASDDALSACCLELASELAGEMDMDGAAFQITHITHKGRTTVILLRPYYNDVPVYGSFVVFTFNGDRALISIKSEGFGNKLEGGYNLDGHHAAQIALDALKKELGVVVKQTNAWLLPYKMNDGIFIRAVFEITCSADDAAFRPALFVDASSGEIIAAENRLVYEQLPGRTYGLVHPFYSRDNEEECSFPEEYIYLRGVGQMYSGSDGGFSFEVNPGAAPFQVRSELRGRWVDVNFEDGADASQEVRVDRVSPVTINWSDGDSRPDERTLYVHTNGIHAFFKALDPAQAGLDYPLPAVCAYGDHYDNAFWNGEGIYFGEGSEMDNFALYKDIIQHEYTHGITSQIYPWDILPYRGESGALNEAWSDYFPCSISNEPYMGEGGLVRMGGFIRLIDNELVYPRDWFGEVHYDSRIISAAMWHTRQVLGASYTDSLFHFAKYRLGNTFISYFTDILETDDDDGDITNGTPNDRVLYQKFWRHGIGPGLIPKLKMIHAGILDDNHSGASGDGDYQWEPGEILRIGATMERLGSLFPPPAENVKAVLTTDSPWLSVVRGEINFGGLRVGDVREADAPFLIHIDNDAPLCFGWLYFNFSADGFEALGRDSLRIPIGQTQVLLVNDGREGVDRTHWFRTALDSNGVIYAEEATFGEHLDLDWRLPQFRSLIWFTGDSRTGFLDDQNIDRLSRFMDNGGNVMLTGQSISARLQNGSFLEDYFGTRVIADSTDQVYLQGVEGDIIGQGLYYLLIGAAGAMNQRCPATLEALDGIEFAHYARAPGRPAGGVRYEVPASGAKTVFLGFGFEGVSGHGGTGTRTRMMNGIMGWFGEPTSAPYDETPIAGKFLVGAAYPNPFNSRTIIPVTISRTGMLEYAVFDLIGREIGRGARVFTAGNNHLILNSEGWNSGIYLVKVSMGDEVSVRRVVNIQ